MILLLFPFFNLHFSSDIVTEKCVLAKAAGGVNRKQKRQARRKDGMRMFQKREVRLPRGISAEEQLREALDMADAVVIGAGAGLSTSAGFLYSGDRFSDILETLRRSTDFTICIREGFYPYKLWKSTGLTGAGTFR